MNKKDIDVLTGLAKKVAELAALPIQEEKRDLWKRHNKLERTRPLIFCDPENGWGEIILAKDMLCTDELARGWEWELRRTIFWGEEMGDDKVIEPFFNVPFVSSSSGWGKERVILGGGSGSAYSWEPLIADYDRDLPLLHFPHISVDHELSENLFDQAMEIFGGILKVRQKQSWWWTSGLTATAIEFRGIEQYMYDMYDYPDEVHKMMEFLCEGTCRMFDSFEERGYLCSNADDSYVGSGGFGYTDEITPAKAGEHVTTTNMWGFCESQETVSVSPEMFEEFVFPYQEKILKRFALNCYGCCEPLDTRWDVVKRLPNLRRISVSPWCNLQKMAEFLKDDYIYSMKPNPSYIAVATPDFDHIKATLKSAFSTAKDCRVEVIMKDNNTIGKNPQNVIDWCRIAKEAAMSVT